MNASHEIAIAHLSQLRHSEIPLARWPAEVRQIANDAIDAYIIALRNPVTLNFSAPGYVTITDGKGERCLKEPPYAGFTAMRQLFLLGVNASSALHAADLVDNSPIAGAMLRGQLKRVAKWFEVTAKCREVAQQLRRPFLSISDEGDITFNPTAGLINISY